MIKFTPFRAGHLQFFKPQAAQQQEYWAVMQSGEIEALEGPMSLSAWARNACVGAGGLIALRPHRAIAWMILAQDASKHLFPIARKIQRVAAASPYKRIEITVEEGFAQGERFAKLLGAVCETPQPMRYYGSTGNHERMFALIKGD